MVLRYRDADGALTDALGELLSFDDEVAVVRTRRGDVRVPRDAIVTGKEVPPAAKRPGRPHRVVGAADLQELMVGGMPPLESHWQGRWLLRAANGYTGRANSVLPLGDPGMPVADAITAIERWYDSRGLPGLVQVYGPTAAEALNSGIGRDLVAAEWRAMPDVLVMTAPTDAVVAAAGSPEHDVAVTERVSDRWIAGATARERDNSGTLTQILGRVRDGRYVTLGTDRIPDAVGRLALGRGWAGIFAVHVQPSLRRQGLARRTVGVLARAAQAAGAQATYLQVEAGNTAAVTLYESLGFETHHEYAYLRHPSQASTSGI